MGTCNVFRDNDEGMLERLWNRFSMSAKDFKWDKFCSSASFKEIRDLSPLLGQNRLPSMRSPDQKFFYSSSQDIAIEIDNERELRLVLELVKNSYFRAIHAKPMNLSKAYFAEVDFFEICMMLSGCVLDPEEFSDPDSLLSEENMLET